MEPELRFLDSAPANCKEKLVDLYKRFNFSESEYECFQFNQGELTLARLPAFETYLQKEKEKRVPKKQQLLRTARPFGGENLKRRPLQVSPVAKRRETEEVKEGPPVAKSHQISVKNSINTGKLEKRQLSRTANVKLLGQHFWVGERQAAYSWMDEAISERMIRRDERLQEWEAPVTAALQRKAQEATVGTVGVPCQSETILCGRIACEGLEGQLNEHSMLLEGSTLAGGAKVQLNMGNCKMAAFPGQIVGVVGRSGMTGSTFHAWEFLSGLPHPLEPLSPSSSLHALVLAGPFSEKEKLDFSALDSALADAALVRPEVLILLGPFLDCNNSKVQAGETHLPGSEDPCSFEEVYTQTLLPILEKRLAPLRRGNPPTEVLIVPSLDEVLCFHPLPQPPMDAVLGPWLETDILELQRMGVRFLPNPAHLEINGVKVSLTSADALSPMLRELVVQGDKVQEALRLLLHQRCLFPMVPREPAQVCEARAQALDFPAAPHLCIFPSLCGSMSATSVDGTLFLNPGPLCEAAGPGTFAELWVAEGQGSLKERMRVDFKKIEKS